MNGFVLKNNPHIGFFLSRRLPNEAFWKSGDVGCQYWIDHIAGAGVQRAASPLCRGAGAAAHCWGQGATPIGRVQGGSACAVCRGGEPLLRCPEVENLGPGKVDACVNL